MDRSDVVARLDTLLEEERQVLLSGKIMGLQEILHRKAELLRRLTGAGPDATQAAALKDKAARNAMLLDAAASGIRTVRDRVREIKRAANTLETYSSEGRRRVVAHAPASFERRA